MKALGLSPGNEPFLVTMLQVADAVLEDARPTAASRVLRVFTHQVTFLSDRGLIDRASADALIADVEQVAHRPFRAADVSAEEIRLLSGLM